MAELDLALARGRVARFVAASAGCMALAACGGGGHARVSGVASPRAALDDYVQRIEPLRLAVDRLLQRADPILGAYEDHRITPAIAARRMGALERRFAAYAVEVAAIEPATGPLRTLHAPYAETYVLEDSYLNALVAGLRGRDLDHLPDTQNRQRTAIIGWRVGLAVLARRLTVRLPLDLQQAGRGEIAPSLGAS